MTFHNVKKFTFIFLIFSGEHLSMESQQNHKKSSINSAINGKTSSKKIKKNHKQLDKDQISDEDKMIIEMLKKQQNKIEINMMIQLAQKYNISFMGEQIFCQENQQYFSTSAQPVFFPHQGQPMVFPTNCTLAGWKPFYQQSQSYNGYNLTQYYYPLLWPAHSIPNIFNNPINEDINSKPTIQWADDKNIENTQPLPSIDKFNSKDRKAPGPSILKNKYTGRWIKLPTHSILKKPSQYPLNKLRIFKITKDISKQRIFQKLYQKKISKNKS
jgi:hypothetical protein